MNNFIRFTLSALIIVGMSSEVMSRGASTRSTSVSRSSSSAKVYKPSTPSVKPSTPSTPVKSVNTTYQSSPSREITKSSTPIKAVSTNNKPKAVSMSSIDKKKAKALASQNKEAATKYGSKSNAEKAYRENLMKNNHYNSETPPSVMPKSVPQTVVINNTPIQTSYGRLPGGYYGYGYYDPVTHMMIELAANQMMIDNINMREAGYGDWDRPVVYHNTGSMGFFTIMIIITIGVIIIAVIIVAVVKGL